MPIEFILVNFMDFANIINDGWTLMSAIENPVRKAHKNNDNCKNGESRLRRLYLHIEGSNKMLIYSK